MAINLNVLAQQKALNAKGAKLVEDGIMGPKTQAAIKQYNTPNMSTAPNQSKVPNMSTAPTSMGVQAKAPAPVNQSVKAPPNMLSNAVQAVKSKVITPVTNIAKAMFPGGGVDLSKSPFDPSQPYKANNPFYAKKVEPDVAKQQQLQDLNNPYKSAGKISPAPTPTSKPTPSATVTPNTTTQPTSSVSTYIDNLKTQVQPTTPMPTTSPVQPNVSTTPTTDISNTGILEQRQTGLIIGYTGLTSIGHQKRILKDVKFMSGKEVTVMTG